MVKKISARATQKWLRSLDWPYLFIWVAAVVAAVLLLTYNLNGLTAHKISPLELANLNASNSLTSLIHHPLFLPYNFIEFLIIKAGGAGHVFILRLASVGFALAAIWLFLAIARRWFSRPTYILATVLFGSSLWILHFGRLIMPTILFVLAPLAIIRTVLWLQGLKKGQLGNHYRLLLVLAATLALTLYVPGAWLFWLVLAVWQWKKLALLVKKLDWHVELVALALVVILLAPLAYGLWLEPSLVKSWIGLNTAHNSTLGILELFGKQPMYFLARGPVASATMWLGREPILDAFSAAMALAGLGYYILQFKLKQARLLILMLTTSLVIFVLSGGSIGASAGLVYLLVAAGIGYLLAAWRKVFPKNPLAYGGAVLLLTLVTALAVIYTTRSYFVAWRYHPATKQAFSIRI